MSTAGVPWLTVESELGAPGDVGEHTRASGLDSATRVQGVRRPADRRRQLHAHAPGADRRRHARRHRQPRRRRSAVGVGARRAAARRVDRRAVRSSARQRMAGTRTASCTSSAWDRSPRWRASNASPSTSRRTPSTRRRSARRPGRACGCRSASRPPSTWCTDRRSQGIQADVVRRRRDVDRKARIPVSVIWDSTRPFRSFGLAGSRPTSPSPSTLVVAFALGAAMVIATTRRHRRIARARVERSRRRALRVLPAPGRPRGVRSRPERRWSPRCRSSARTSPTRALPATSRRCRRWRTNTAGSSRPRSAS